MDRILARKRRELQIFKKGAVFLKKIPKLENNYYLLF